MTFGEKLSKLRKENNYTQEQLANILEVSRQSVSKWESDLSYPETDKLIRMAKLFHCSTDYLLRDECMDENRRYLEGNGQNPGKIMSDVGRWVKRQKHEWKSSKTILGMPLYHIGRNAHGFFAIGLKATGVFSIGLLSRGIVSLGLLSLGIVSIGMLAIGLLGVGVFALGVIAAGSVALGMLVAGAISVGIFSFGALSMGEFSVGALAIGKYAAFGDSAKAMIAVGDSEAVGSVYSKLGELTSADVSYIREWLDANVPSYLNWAKEMFKFFITSEG